MDINYSIYTEPREKCSLYPFTRISYTQLREIFLQIDKNNYNINWAHFNIALGGYIIYLKKLHKRFSKNKLYKKNCLKYSDDITLSSVRFNDFLRKYIIQTRHLINLYLREINTWPSGCCHCGIKNNFHVINSMKLLLKLGMLDSNEYKFSNANEKLCCEDCKNNHVILPRSSFIPNYNVELQLEDISNFYDDNNIDLDQEPYTVNDANDLHHILINQFWITTMHFAIQNNSTKYDYLSSDEKSSGLKFLFDINVYLVEAEKSIIRKVKKHYYELACNYPMFLS